MEVQVCLLGGLQASEGEKREFVLDRLGHVRRSMEGPVDASEPKLGSLLPIRSIPET